jgi:hypothetical protein
MRVLDNARGTGVEGSSKRRDRDSSLIGRDSLLVQEVKGVLQTRLELGERPQIIIESGAAGARIPPGEEEQ